MRGNTHLCPKQTTTMMPSTDRFLQVDLLQRKKYAVTGLLRTPSKITNWETRVNRVTYSLRTVITFEANDSSSLDNCNMKHTRKLGIEIFT